MKRKLQKLLIAIAGLLVSVNAFATTNYDFKKDGICYNITSSEDRTVKVTYNDYHKNFGLYNYYTEYAGKISIPQKVIYNSITYSVTSIGDYVFSDCSGLTSVEIPNSVTSIGVGALSNCSNIRTIYCQSATPPSYPSSFADDVLMYSTLYVPTGCKSAYEAVDPWRNFWNIEEMEFNGIEDIIADSNEISVMAQDGEIVVNGIKDVSIDVYNLNGQLVYTGDDTTISVADKGIYIVKVSGKTFKIAL